MEEVSYQNHIVSSNIFQIIWPKYVNLMNFRFYRISLYWLRWSACHEGVLMSDDLMKMKILWILVVILSQHLHSTASVQNLPLNISLRYFDWFLLVDHPDYKVLHHILDQCSSSYTRYKWTILTTKTKIQIKIKFYGNPIYLKSYNMFT